MFENVAADTVWQYPPKNTGFSTGTSSLTLEDATTPAPFAGEKALKVAQLHSLESGIEVDYKFVSVETLAAQQPESFDVITCLEMLEHVPNPASVIAACAKLVKPQGHVFFSTINRNPKAYIFAVLGAEYILNLLPRGTHDYEKFIKPSELASWARAEQLSLHGQIGMSYNPITQQYSLGADTSVNYLMHMVKA
jgi:2-polyprenyl-6-hydroxyphenyl methylase/3-demethylubiquinone-9 3-methyltransferase